MRLSSFAFPLLATLCLGLAITATAQDYEIKLVRTVKVGDRYGVVSNATEVQSMATVVGGQAAPPRDQEISASMTAKAEVLAITPNGREAKTSFTLAKLTKTVGGKSADAAPAGTVVIADRAGKKTAFTVAGAPVAPELAAVLKLVISLDTDEGANDDAIFGSKARKQVGDSWPIDSAAAAADAASKGGITIDPADITGTPTLVEAQKDGLRIAARMEMKKVSVPLPPGMAVTKGGFTATFSGVYPVDLAKRATRVEMTMDGTIECAGKTGDKEMSMVMTMKQAKDVTFTAP